MDDQQQAEPAGASQSQAGQILGSIAVALLIAAGVIAAVTYRLGPTSIAELRAQEEVQEEAEDQAEEAAEAEKEEADARADQGRERQRGTVREAVAQGDAVATNVAGVTAVMIEWSLSSLE